MIKNNLVSVIIPTYNRVNGVKRLLELIGQQTYPMDSIEVIIIDDGSSDSTPNLSRITFPYHFLYHRQDNQGEIPARNIGAKQSHGSILIFLDDDIIIEPDYISCLAKAHDQYEKVIVLGNLIEQSNKSITHFSRIYTQEYKNKIKGEFIRFEQFTECTSGVLSVKREHFFSLGMMPLGPSGGRNRWGGLEFGYVAHNKGFQFIRCENAPAYHVDYSIIDLMTSCNRWRIVSSEAVYLFRKYPKLVRKIPMFEDKLSINWRKDSYKLITRKIARSITSSRILLVFLMKAALFLENIFPYEPLLKVLYRWTIGGYIFRGFREGIKIYGPLIK
jgi:glycosyltransferase involved in cell wall biosynthesis